MANRLAARGVGGQRGSAGVVLRDNFTLRFQSYHHTATPSTSQFKVGLKQIQPDVFDSEDTELAVPKNLTFYYWNTVL